MYSLNLTICTFRHRTFTPSVLRDYGPVLLNYGKEDAYLQCRTEGGILVIWLTVLVKKSNLTSESVNTKFNTIRMSEIYSSFEFNEGV